MFKSRYGMVTYTLIPYNLVQKAGLKQDEILNPLCEKISNADELSLREAEEFLRDKYLPFIENQRIELKNYVV